MRPVNSEHLKKMMAKRGITMTDIKNRQSAEQQNRAKAGTLPKITLSPGTSWFDRTYVFVEKGP